MDNIELYNGEKKAIQYEMFLDNAAFVPDTVSVSIYDSSSTLTLSTSASIVSNNISFIAPLSLTETTGKYKGIITVAKDEQIFVKIININVKTP